MNEKLKFLIKYLFKILGENGKVNIIKKIKNCTNIPKISNIFF